MPTILIRSPPRSHAAAACREPRPADPSDRGAVTVEAAFAVTTLVVVLTLLLGCVSAVINQLRCTDAAGAAARLVARGEPDRASHAVDQIGPRGARLAIHREDDAVSVEVSVPALGGALPWTQIRGAGFAVLEPGVGDRP